jgi:hypothetical protein
VVVGILKPSTYDLDTLGANEGLDLDANLVDTFSN